MSTAFGPSVAALLDECVYYARWHRSNACAMRGLPLEPRILPTLTPPADAPAPPQTNNTITIEQPPATTPAQPVPAKMPAWAKWLAGAGVAAALAGPAAAWWLTKDGGKETVIKETLPVDPTLLYLENEGYAVPPPRGT